MLGTSRVQPSPEFWEKTGIVFDQEATLEKNLLNVISLFSFESRLPQVMLSDPSETISKMLPFAPRRTYFFYKKHILNNYDELLPEFCYLHQHYKWQLNPILLPELFKSGILPDRMDGNFLHQYVPEQLEVIRQMNGKYKIKKQFIDPDIKKSPTIVKKDIGGLVKNKKSIFGKASPQSLLHFNLKSLDLMPDAALWWQILEAHPEQRDQWIYNLITYDEKELLNAAYKNYQSAPDDSKWGNLQMKIFLRAIPVSHHIHLLKSWHQDELVLQRQQSLIQWILAGEFPLPVNLTPILSQVTSLLSTETLKKENVTSEWIEALVLRIHPDSGKNLLYDLPSVFQTGTFIHRHHRWTEIINLRREMYLMMSSIGFGKPE